jgi:hypothetical protein
LARLSGRATGQRLRRRSKPRAAEFNRDPGVGNGIASIRPCSKRYATIDASVPFGGPRPGRVRTSLRGRCTSMASRVTGLPRPPSARGRPIASGVEPCRLQSPAGCGAPDTLTPALFSSALGRTRTNCHTQDLTIRGHGRRHRTASLTTCRRQTHHRRRSRLPDGFAPSLNPIRLSQSRK